MAIAVLALHGPRTAAFDWSGMASGQWTRVPTQGVAAPKVFHGGSAIAPGSGEVFFFGSDTHEAGPLEQGESNAVWRLDLGTLSWTQDYAADPPETYRILPDGQTETTTGRPWAMHAFDAVEYDPVAGRVVVVSHPAHSRVDPERRFPWFEGDWYRRLTPSHWEYDPRERRWHRLETNAPALFAQALTWDGALGHLVGHDAYRTYSFDRARHAWRPIGRAPDVPGYSHAMVFDAFAGTPLSFGNHRGSDRLFALTGGGWTEVEATGFVLPASGAAMAYDSTNGVMVYLGIPGDSRYDNPTGRSRTFLYDSRQRAWRALDVPSPPLYGLNFLMQYDPVRNVVLHFEGPQRIGGRLNVWAFRVRR